MKNRVKALKKRLDTATAAYRSDRLSYHQYQHELITIKKELQAILISGPKEGYTLSLFPVRETLPL